MISKTIGFRGLAYFQTNPNGPAPRNPIGVKTTLGSDFGYQAATAVQIRDEFVRGRHGLARLQKTHDD